MSTQTIEQQVPAGTYAVDPVHSSISFAITHNGVATFRSGFGSYEARLSGGETPRLVGSVDVGSVKIDEEQLKGHLLSPDFFDAGRYPQLRFESGDLDVEDDGSVRLSGELEIRGAKHEVEASGRFGRLGADLAATPASGSRWRRPSTVAASGSTGTPSCPAVARSSTTRSAIAVELELVEEAE